MVTSQSVGWFDSLFQGGSRYVLRTHTERNRNSPHVKRLQPELYSLLTGRLRFLSPGMTPGKGQGDHDARAEHDQGVRRGDSSQVAHSETPGGTLDVEDAR